MGSIGENIRKYRESAGMSQEQLAERIGKTRSAVSQYESGKIIPRMGVIEDIAQVFFVNKNDLLGYEADDASLTLDEQELLRIYRSVEPWGRELILKHAVMVIQNAPRS